MELLHNLYFKLNSKLFPNIMTRGSIINASVEPHMSSRRFHSEGFTEAYLYRGLETEQFTGPQSVALEIAIESNDPERVVHFVKELPTNMLFKGLRLLNERAKGHSGEGRLTAINAILVLGEKAALASSFPQSEQWRGGCASTVRFLIDQSLGSENLLLNALEEAVRRDEWTALNAVRLLRRQSTVLSSLESLITSARKSLKQILPNLSPQASLVNNAFYCINAIFEEQERESIIGLLLAKPDIVQALMIARHVTNKRTSYGHAETVEEALDASPNPQELTEIGINLEMLERACAPLLTDSNEKVRKMTERFLQTARSA
jgi:hypothetical protein